MISVLLEELEITGCIWSLTWYLLTGRLGENQRSYFMPAVLDEWLAKSDSERPSVPQALISKAVFMWLATDLEGWIMVEGLSCVSTKMLQNIAPWETQRLYHVGKALQHMKLKPTKLPSSKGPLKPVLKRSYNNSSLRLLQRPPLYQGHYNCNSWFRVQFIYT